MIIMGKEGPEVKVRMMKAFPDLSPDRIRAEIHLVALLRAFRVRPLPSLFIYQL